MSFHWPSLNWMKLIIATILAVWPASGFKRQVFVLIFDAGSLFNFCTGCPKGQFSCHSPSFSHYDYFWQQSFSYSNFVSPEVFLATKLAHCLVQQDAGRICHHSLWPSSNSPSSSKMFPLELSAYLLTMVNIHWYLWLWSITSHCKYDELGNLSCHRVWIHPLSVLQNKPCYWCPCPVICRCPGPALCQYQALLWTQMIRPRSPALDTCGACQARYEAYGYGSSSPS